MDLSEIKELARTIQERVEFMTTSLESSSKTEGPPGMQDLPPAVLQSIQLAIAATSELHQLLLGPIGFFVELPQKATTLLTFSFVHRYGVPKLVPVDESVSYKEVAERIKLDESDVRRLLQLAIADGLFAETEPGMIGHNSRSLLMLKDPAVAGWVDLCVLDKWPALAKLPEAMETWPGSHDPNHTAYALLHGCDPFTRWEQDPLRAEGFANAMNFLHQVSGWHPGMVLLQDDPILAKGGLIVDVGGSSGHASFALAREFPTIRLIIQDMPQTIEAAKRRVPLELQSRVTLMAHNFWTMPQPIYGADIYYLRWIMHDWSDQFCVKLLQNLVPALKQGSRVIVNEPYIPDGKVGSSYLEGWARNTDLTMKALSNGKVRELGEWEKLFQEADRRYMFRGARKADSHHAIIEAEWSEE